MKSQASWGWHSRQAWVTSEPDWNSSLSNALWSVWGGRCGTAAQGSALGWLRLEAKTTIGTMITSKVNASPISQMNLFLRRFIGLLWEGGRETSALVRLPQGDCQ